jgi:hypothetical protein
MRYEIGDGRVCMGATLKAFEDMPASRCNFANQLGACSLLVSRTTEGQIRRHDSDGIPHIACIAEAAQLAFLEIEDQFPRTKPDPRR